MRPDSNGLSQAARFIIVGRTSNGKTFRPSDWAERLCSVMAAYRPGYVAGSYGDASLLGFSPYAQPITHDGVKSAVVDQRIEGLEPMAWSFVVGFARDNDLVMQPLV